MLPLHNTAICIFSSGRTQAFVFSSSRRIRLYHIRFPLSTPFSKKVEKILRFFSQPENSRKVHRKSTIRAFCTAEKFFMKIFSHHIAKRKGVWYTISVSPISSVLRQAGVAKLADAPHSKCGEKSYRFESGHRQTEVFLPQIPFVSKRCRRYFCFCVHFYKS